MPYVFASNVDNFKGAVSARFFSGPLNTAYSTPVLNINPCYPISAMKMLETIFKNHPVFSSKHYYLYWCDANGQEVL